MPFQKSPTYLSPPGDVAAPEQLVQTVSDEAGHAGRRPWAMALFDTSSSIMIVIVVFIVSPVVGPARIESNIAGSHCVTSVEILRHRPSDVRRRPPRFSRQREIAGSPR
jgi:hypothetical protein